MTLTNWISGETKVRGTYCGVAFTGTIIAGRNTPDYRNWILDVELDAPIMVFGQERTKLVDCWTNSQSVQMEAA